MCVLYINFKNVAKKQQLGQMAKIAAFVSSLSRHDDNIADDFCAYTLYI